MYIERNVVNDTYRLTGTRDEFKDWQTWLSSLPDEYTKEAPPAVKDINDKLIRTMTYTS